MTRVKKVIAAIAALAALAVGGAAIANAGGDSQHQSTPPANENQAGDQDQGEAPDVKGDDANEQGEANDADRGEKQDSGTDDANEQGEANDGPDHGESESPGQ